MAARLIVSLSGLSDASSLERASAFVAELDARGVTCSQLLRPAALAPGDALVDWMLARRAAGDAIVLHGYDHTPDPLGNQLLGRRAEFATLPRHEAGLRLTAARRVLTAVDLRTDLFVPPRWLASEGTAEALAEQGFAVLADENGVRLLGDGSVVPARVLGFRADGDRRPTPDAPARRTEVAPVRSSWTEATPVRSGQSGRSAEAWRCRVLGAEVARTARRGGLVRINVRAKDLRRPARRDAVLAAVDKALELGAQPVTYRRTALARVA